MSHSVVNLIGLFALPQSLIETFAQSNVLLALGALDELLNLPRAGAGGFVRLLLLHGLAVRGWLSVRLLGRVRLRRWRGRSGGRSWGSFTAAAAAEGSGQAGADHVSNS